MSAPVKNGVGGSGADPFYTLFGVGYVADNFNFLADGDYQFQILTYGSLCQGAWPILELNIDGSPVSSAVVDFASPATVTFQAPIGAGTHQVGAQFANDCYVSPTEDRNLYVKSITIVPVSPPITLQAVTMSNLSSSGVQTSNDYWVQLGVGGISDFVNFTQDGYYQFQTLAFALLANQSGHPWNLILMELPLIRL